jgi:hypothetical protein
MQSGEAMARTLVCSAGFSRHFLSWPSGYRLKPMLQTKVRATKNEDCEL